MENFNHQTLIHKLIDVSLTYYNRYAHFVINCDVTVINLCAKIALVPFPAFPTPLYYAVAKNNNHVYYLRYTSYICISINPEDFIMQVSKWGNSLAVRLPAMVVEALELKEGDDIAIYIAGDRVFELEKKASSQELLARMRKYRGRLPADFKFDRLEANENR
jgi:antitoxin MazE